LPSPADQPHNHGNFDVGDVDMPDSPDGGDMTIACPHCGSQTSLDSTSCTNCGNLLDSVDPQWSVSATSGGSGWARGLTGVGCAAVVLLAAVAAFFIGCSILFRF
jgi:hypothetical protein